MLPIVHEYRDIAKKKNSIAVCVKWLKYSDIDFSKRLIEWVELIKILGADHIYINQLYVHPNMAKVIDHYVHSGIATLTKYTLPGNQPDGPTAISEYSNIETIMQSIVLQDMNELFPINDCLYRSIGSYKYLAIIDIDEIIVPDMFDNWKNMIRYLKEKSDDFDYVSFQRYLFLPSNISDDIGVSKYSYMMNHVERYKDLNAKSIIKLDRAMITDVHGLRACINNGTIHKCKQYSADTSIARVNHYRNECGNTLENRCKHIGRDETLFKYRDILDDAIKDALIKIGIEVQ